MHHEPETAGMSPPVARELEAEVQSRWPTVIGVISLIYAIGGLLCGLGYGVSVFFMEALTQMVGMDVPAPAIIKVTGLIMSLCMLGLGILMLSGAVSTLRRRRSGPGLLRTWAMLRIVLLLIGVAVTVLTAPAQIQLQRTIQDQQNQAFRESGRTELIVEKTDEEIWNGLLMQTAIATAVFAVYPFFLGLYLSRAKLKAEVETWR